MYQLVAIPSEKPDDLNDAEGEYPHHGEVVKLRKGATTIGTFWLAAEMPKMQAGAFIELIAACKVEDDTLADDDCAKWLAKRARILGSTCSDPDDLLACTSFRGLVSASDPDVMDILSRMEHTYVCFHPNEDSFFELWFSEPREHAWRKADADDLKVWRGLVTGTLIQFAGPGLNYYDKGVKNRNAGIDGIGSIWSYLPTTSDISRSTMAHLATSNDAELRGSHFSIDTSRITAVESYKNKAKEDIRHTLIVQRSTGRFSETYEKESSGKTFSSYSGRCLVVPNATGNEHPQ